MFFQVVAGQKSLGLVAFASLVLWAQSSSAEPRVHLGAGVAHAVGRPQSKEFGFGGAGALALELPLTPALGFQAELSSIVLAKGDAPAAGIRPKETGVSFGGMIGARVRPFPARPGGLWIDANFGALTAGPSLVPGFDAHIGWDFRVGRGRLDVGPMVGYTQLFDADGNSLSGDAHVPWVGVAFSLGAEKPHEVVTAPPRRDRDQDMVFDDEDACPDVPGIETNDPKTNGCPRGDRDEDKIFDDVDACPDVAGIRTNDPKTNGCPRGDRDKDTVFDDEDACPDVPGNRTEDPKTNGCPPAAGKVRVEGTEIVLGEVILFDTDSLRVRHASWPLVKKVADLLKANPDILEVYIEGHADQTGKDDYNVALSQARAESVKRLLIHFGVDPSRVTTHAFGNLKPRVEGSSKEALHQNRRVEFTITRTSASNLGGKP